MIEFIKILKNDDVINYSIIICFSILLILSIMQKRWISIDISTYKRINYSILIIFLFFLFSNVILTKNYERLWRILYLVIFYLFQYLLPKFIKWYDSKVDRFTDKLSDRSRQL